MRMQKKIISLVLLISLFASPALAASDTGEHWAKDAITFVAARELFGGVGDGRFDPDGTMTRAMLVTVMGRLAMVKPTEDVTISFTDVEKDAWYAPYVAWATENKLVGGVGNNLFAPDRAVTRAELTTILYKYAQFAGFATDAPEIDLSTFKDLELVPNWATESMRWAVSQNIISGKTGNLLDPQGNATRAEVAVVIKRFIDKILEA